MSNYRIPIFTGDERTFELWEIKFLGLMRIKQLLSVFQDETTPNEEDNATAFAELIQCLDDRSLSLIIRDDKNKGRESLEILRNHYLPKGKPRVITLYQELTSLIKSSTESVTDYILRAETAAASLKTAGEQISDSLLVAMTLKGLPSDFKAFTTVVTQKEKPMYPCLFLSSKWHCGISRIRIKSSQLHHQMLWHFLLRLHKVITVNTNPKQLVHNRSGAETAK